MALLEAATRDAIADWIEVTVLARNRSTSHEAILRAARDDLALSEERVSLAFHTLASRLTVLGDSYPFELTPVAIQPRPNARELPYSVLLLISPGSPVRQLIWGEPPIEVDAAFERLTALALETLFGSGAQAIRFGWPGDDDRPPAFNDAVAWLAKKMGIQIGAGYRQPRRRDGGVDVVAWRRFPDGKSGFPVILVQCTLQSRLVEKALDIDTRIWSSWLTLDTEPMTVLATPGTIGNAETWNEIAMRCMILERMRLAGLLAHDACAQARVSDSFASELLGSLAPHLSGIN